VGCGQAEIPQGAWEIHGRVVDEHGEPVEGFVAASLWSSNGPTWYDNGFWRNDNGTITKASSQAESLAIWIDEGVLEPYPTMLATTSSGNEFTLTLKDRAQSALYVVDRERRRGGCAQLKYEARNAPVTVKLLPLVRVTGKIYCPQATRTPDWTMAVVHLPADHGNLLSVARCGSLKGEFSFLLPPGEYDLQVYSQSPDAEMPAPAERALQNAPDDMPANFNGIRIDVPKGTNDLDLGVLNVQFRNGRGDYSAFYGKQPPGLDITDAVGISKDVRLDDLRGKWVLLEFWSLSCGECIARHLPRLATFYESHAADRERFEILSICIANGPEVKSATQFEPWYAPLVEKSWGGKRLPFPILIDGEGKTNAAYGIGGYPTTLLIDPEGNLVKWGDQTVLAEKLDAN
jgi:thiol-disulfide isomerase/thioredoxin